MGTLVLDSYRVRSNVPHCNFNLNLLDANMNVFRTTKSLIEIAHILRSYTYTVTEEKGYREIRIDGRMGLGEKVIVTKNLSND